MFKFDNCSFYVFCLGYNITYDNKHLDSHYNTSSDPIEIMKEMYTNGPVDSAFPVYADFPNYKSGIWNCIILFFRYTHYLAVTNLQLICVFLFSLKIVWKQNNKVFWYLIRYFDFNKVSFNTEHAETYSVNTLYGSIMQLLFLKTTCERV